MDHLANALTQAFLHEGGFSNNLKDSGGTTNWGITEKLARQYNYFGPMQDMSREQAIRIYQQEFWYPMQCKAIADLSPSTCYEMFDTAINQGKDRAVKYLQRALNLLNREQADYPDITMDGKVGPETLGTLRTYLQRRRAQGELVLVRMLNAQQGAFYMDLAEARAKDEAFIFGWFLHRIQ